MQQRSEQWREIRLGKFTGSEVHKLMGARGFGKTGETYIIEKVSEILTGQAKFVLSTPAMEYGTNLEPIAAEFYEKATGLKLSEYGFKEYKDFGGVSPDRLIEGQNKGVEIKCPFTHASHTKHLMIKSNADLRRVKPEYYWQIQYCMLAFNFDKWDFVSFQPDFLHEDYDNRMIIIEIRKDENDQVLLIQRLHEANELKNKYLQQINL